MKTRIKNILLTTLSLVLVAALAVGGTLAYLQAEDSDVNVMTLGNVKIEQHEYEREVDADGNFVTDTIDGVSSYVLKDFTQGKPLLPSAINTTTWEGWDWDTTVVRMTQVDSYGYMSAFKAASNAQDKFVTVENTGMTDAYVRTLVAIECGSTNGSLVNSSYHQTWTNNQVGIIEIDGNNYYLTEYIYAGGQLSDGSWRHENGVLPAGDTSYPSLAQVYIHSRATNEDCKALDGNSNGTLDILVLSQAVQADGFENAETALDAAFGDITTTNHPWNTNAPVIPVAVATADELAEALENGENVVLANDINMGTQSISITNDIVINLNGNDIVANHGAAAVTDRASSAVLYIDGADVVIEGNGDIKNTADDAAYSVFVDNGAKVTIKDGNYITHHDAVYVRDGELIIEGGFFQATADTNPNADYVHPNYPDEPASHTAIVINCNKDAYINAKEGTTYSGGITAKVTIIGGTFVNEDPSNIFEGWYVNDSYVPEGYKVISETQANGDVWYTVVPE